MPDISMCDNETCPLAKGCYRNPDSGTKPNQYRQAWMQFRWTDKDGRAYCGDYWPTHENGKKVTP